MQRSGAVQGTVARAAITNALFLPGGDLLVSNTSSDEDLGEEHCVLSSFGRGTE